ncbi:MAG: GntR family transcriptional regulator [Proteobacteria bacterium]|nr:MAG: GntR family transcriptional regulator [Pseudomonadota bacterium]
MSDLVSSVTSQLTLADRVFMSIQDAIIKGQLVPGQRLSEAELSSTHGVSRGPLREAIRRLEGRGLVTRRPHAGISVVELGFDELVEIYQIRESMEGLACKLAAERMSDDEIGDIRLLLEQHKRLVDEDDGRSYFQREGDFDFHYRIVNGCQNVRLYHYLCGELYHLVRMYRYRLSLRTERPHKALKEHTQILDAIEARDGELAEILMRRHIRAARMNIEKRYQQGTIFSAVN